ncbi:trace amine-associated receptor 4-like [Actinia tenebrosa]|uniref:Trace amine-associated receptor 4-like n=1 Tax=Actinia tenebrosa TaxID=6105 RepID=A0A6P8IML8_ACTTE|nr:trace amine-associated receptor 4-like [Actinia tenebrosa]
MMTNLLELTNSSSIRAISYFLTCYFIPVNWENPTYVYVMGIVTSTLNALFVVPAFFGNVMVIAAIYRTPSLHSPSNFLICSLAATDFLTGVLCQPLHVVYKVAELSGDFDTFCKGRVAMEVIGWIVSAVSCVTLCMISIERYLALHFHLRYHDIISIPKLILPISISWVIFTLLSVSRFFNTNSSVFTMVNMSILVLSLLLTFWAYAKIYSIVRRHRRQIQSLQRASHLSGNQTEMNSLDFAKYQKSTTTMFLVLGLFLLCYIPFLCVQIASKMVGYTSSIKVAIQFSGTVAFMNASFNPVVYCLRIQHLRCACRKLIPFLKNREQANSLSLSQNAAHNDITNN